MTSRQLTDWFNQYRFTNFQLNAEIENQKRQLDCAQSGQELSAKKIEELEKKIGNMETEFRSVEAELNLEIANLVSKNVTLVAQEVQSRELKNEMQRLT